MPSIDPSNDIQKSVTDPRSEEQRLADALKEFFAGDESKKFLAATERADELLGGEEKKDARRYLGKPDPHLYDSKEERELAVSVNIARKEADEAMARGDFAQSLHAIATLAPFIDAYIDNVSIHTAAADLRENRLKLLNEVREATRVVAAPPRVSLQRGAVQG